MAFRSILSENGGFTGSPDPPEFFVDLGLDRIIDAVTSGKQEYGLKPYFHAPLTDTGSVAYRQEIFRDLDGQELIGCVEEFARGMRAMRDSLALAGKLSYLYQKESLFLEAIIIYCEAVHGLARALSVASIKSRGFSAFRDFLSAYASSGRFTALYEEAKNIRDELSAIKYSIVIKDSTIKVRHYGSEPDYGAELEQAFEKFSQGSVKDYLVKLPEHVEMSHVEAKILEFVALLYPETFKRLNDYYVKNRDFLDETISAFDREVQFYVAYLGHIKKFKDKGLNFCYPQISNPGKDVFVRDGFDLALADKLMGGPAIVCNDFYLEGRERVIVVTGPNQGGKTTFARSFGQLHYLASLGCPVPGREARLFICDRLFTHFEKREDIKGSGGKLQDDLARVFDIIGRATPDSIIILNEIFTSTTLDDAIFLSRKVMERIEGLDLLCVWVTFIDELSVFSEKTVSMVSVVDALDPAKRTFKVVRKPADGLAYAISIAEKYRLTYKFLKERLGHESIPHA